jgi:hypothetical protein
MPDLFVPMQPAPASAGANGFVPLHVKSFASAAGKAGPGSSGAAAASHSPVNCGPPKVTLQRQGDVVSGVRIQCGCGQVIELSCVY